MYGCYAVESKKFFPFTAYKLFRISSVRQGLESLYFSLVQLSHVLCFRISHQWNPKSECLLLKLRSGCNINNLSLLYNVYVIKFRFQWMTPFLMLCLLGIKVSRDGVTEIVYSLSIRPDNIAGLYIALHICSFICILTHYVGIKFTPNYFGIYDRVWKISAWSFKKLWSQMENVNNKTTIKLFKYDFLRKLYFISNCCDRRFRSARVVVDTIIFMFERIDFSTR